MKIPDLHIGANVRHPRYGSGIVTAITEHYAEIRFSDGTQKLSPEESGIEPNEPTANLSGMTVSLQALVTQTVDAVLDKLGIESPESVVEEIASRWRAGTLVMRPSDSTLQSKEVPLETFFHKIVMLRNNLRTLEQKINAHPGLSEADKFEIQQYISRCYGSMTTFNLLFNSDQGQFKSK